MRLLPARDRWTAGVFGAVMLLGVQLQLRGTLLRHFQSTYTVPADQLGLVSTLASVGFLVSIALVSGLLSRFDIRRLLIGGMLLATVSFSFVASAPTYLALLLGMGGVGIVSGTVHGAGRPVVSHVYADQREWGFNLQDLYWAVGATLGPIIAVVAVAVWGWRAAYLVLAIASVLVMATFWRFDQPPSIDQERSLSRESARRFVGETPFVTIVLIFLALSFVESGLFTWLPYLFAKVLPPTVADLSLSVLLAAYIPGRYLFGVASDRYRALNLLVAGAVVAVPLIYLALLGPTNVIRLASTFGIGIVVSGMFPTLLAWTTGFAPEYSAPVNALALGTSSVGFLLYPAAIGVVLAHFETAVAMWGIVATAGVLAALLLYVRFWRNARADGTTLEPGSVDSRVE